MHRNIDHLVSISTRQALQTVLVRTRRLHGVFLSTLQSARNKYLQNIWIIISDENCRCSCYCGYASHPRRLISSYLKNARLKYFLRLTGGFVSICSGGPENASSGASGESRSLRLLLSVVPALISDSGNRFW